MTELDVYSRRFSPFGGCGRGAAVDPMNDALSLEYKLLNGCARGDLDIADVINKPIGLPGGGLYCTLTTASWPGAPAPWTRRFADASGSSFRNPREAAASDNLAPVLFALQTYQTWSNAS